MPIWYDSDPQKNVPIEKALEVWAAAAPGILIGYGSTIGGYATYTRFANDLFEVTGLRTDRPLQKWPGQVLGMVLNYCQENNLPALSSLVVNSMTGMCGVGFGYWHRKVGMEPIGEEAREELAAILRTEVYQHYAGAPEDMEPFHTPIYLEWHERGQWNEGA